MTRDKLIKSLKELVDKSNAYGEKPFAIEGDPEDWHHQADSLLLKYINDQEIADLFDQIEKWYA